MNEWLMTGEFGATAHLVGHFYRRREMLELRMFGEPFEQHPELPPGVWCHVQVIHIRAHTHTHTYMTDRQSNGRRIDRAEH